MQKRVPIKYIYEEDNTNDQGGNIFDNDDDDVLIGENGSRKEEYNKTNEGGFYSIKI